MTRPAPPVPADADLRPLPFMPLHVAKLRDSDLAAECEPEACWYAVLLWCASWHQLPAGSLPDNDVVLCKLIGLGRDLKTFRAHRDQALRGWYEASDGRLYHPVVATEVNNAWRGRIEQAWRTECARIKKANQRNGTDDPTPTLDDYIAGRSPTPSPSASQGTLPLVPEDNADCPEGHGDLSEGTNAVVPRETASKGERQGQGQGQGQGINNNNNRESAPKPNDDVGDEVMDAVSWANRLTRLAGVPHMQPSRIAENVATCAAWLKDGIDLEGIVVPIIETFRLDKPDERLSALRFFDQSVRARIASAEVRRRKGGKGQATFVSTIAAPPVEALRIGDSDDDRVRAIRTRLNGDTSVRPEVIALAIRDDGEPTLLVTARSAFAKSQLDLAKIKDATHAVLGTFAVEISVQ